MSADFNQRWHASYPELGTGPVPMEPIISPTYFALERDRIFRRVWLQVGRIEQLPEVGSYFVKDMAVCRTSIVVVRGKDGQIRAFHNVCSHRSNKLLWGRRGSCQAMTCKFHGWSYALDGKLSFVPDEANFFHFEKGRHGLTPVATDMWNGFIFIHLDPHPTETLREYLAEVADGLTGYPFAQLSTTRFAWRIDLQANWKIAQDAFQESYHLPFMHKRSLPDSYTSPHNPFCHYFGVKLWKHHRRSSSYGNPDHCPSPVETVAQQFGSSVVNRTFTMDDLPPGVNPERRREWALDTFMVFPNFSMFVLNGTYLTHQFWPIAPDRTLWEVSTYFPTARTAGQRFSQEYGKVLLRDVLLEDASTLEATQSVLASGAKTHYVLQEQEILVRHAHKVVEEWVGFYNEREVRQEIERENCDKERELSR